MKEKKPSPIDSSLSRNESPREKLIKELDAIDLSSGNISALSPDELMELHDRVRTLRASLMEDLSQQRPPASEAVREVRSEEEVFNYLSNADEGIQSALAALLSNLETERIIQEKVREYETTHWQEVFTRELAKGITPFGNGQDVIIDFYRQQGIDIQNPTPEDRERFFADKEYTAGSLGPELRRRVTGDPTSAQKYADVEELVWKLLRVPNEKGQLDNLQGDMFDKKLASIKKRFFQ